jgi:hypothetical protein
MTDRPILFSREMVRALLAGRKTQTRRVIEPYIVAFGDSPLPNDVVSFTVVDASGRRVGSPPFRPRVVVGDRFYVCETHFRYGHWEPKGTAKTKLGKQKWQFVEDSDEVIFDAPEVFRRGMHNADPYTPAWHKRTARFMFKKHSRLTLEVKNVKVERLHDISADDARAEGLQKLPATGRYVVEKGDQYFGNASHNPLEVFQMLWDRINGEGAWDANPWVIAYTFVTIHANIDRVAA